MSRVAREQWRLSVVAPVFNEESVLPEFHRRLAAVLDSAGVSCEIIYVNDGSRDRSLTIMRHLQNVDSRVSIVSLSRNFGKEIALTAGLDHVDADAAIVIDTDLQDPPELIPAMIDLWRQGNDIVYAVRSSRRGETWVKRQTASLFYRLMRDVGEAPIPASTGDFRLLSRRCLNALKNCRERHRFMKGLFSWIGFKQAKILYERDARFSGKTSWSYWKLWNFAVEGITSSTIGPLKIASYLGLVASMVALLYGGYIVGRTLILGRELPGYASLIVAVLVLGGVQLMALGIIGEYVGRIFVETKARPLYFVEEYRQGDPSGRLFAEEQSPGYLGSEQSTQVG